MCVTNKWRKKKEANARENEMQKRRVECEKYKTQSYDHEEKKNTKIK